LRGSFVLRWNTHEIKGDSCHFFAVLQGLKAQFDTLLGGVTHPEANCADMIRIFGQEGVVYHEWFDGKDDVEIAVEDGDAEIVEQSICPVYPSELESSVFERKGTLLA
jgi:hypothetical protein